MPAAGNTEKKKSLSLLTYIPTGSQITEGNRPGDRSAACTVCTQTQDQQVELHRQDMEKEFTRPAGKETFQAERPVEANPGADAG